MTHPSTDLDEVIHQRTRLGIMTVLAEAGRVQFGALKDALELTDGNLSRHLQILESAGYVMVEKGYEGRRPRTWVKATRRGQRALATELKLLKALVGAATRGDRNSTMKSELLPST
jgi:DNA-binding MarR family transcriptional regulator